MPMLILMCQLFTAIFVCVNIRSRGHRGGGGDGADRISVPLLGGFFWSLCGFFPQTKIFAALWRVLMTFVFFVLGRLEVSH